MPHDIISRLRGWPVVKPSSRSVSGREQAAINHYGETMCWLIADWIKEECTYKNLSYEDSVRFEVLTMVIAHWPEDRCCIPGPPQSHCFDLERGQHECHYQFIFQQYNKLHMKEYGCNAA